MTGWIEATVQSGEVETPYRRAGAGRTVVALLDRVADPDRADEVLDALVAEGRVVAPALVAAVWRPDPATPPHRRTSPERWLLDVLDGLGLEAPALLVDHHLAHALGELVHGGSDRLGPRVVLGSGRVRRLSRLASELGLVPTAGPKADEFL